MNSSPNHITITISRLYNAESICSPYSLSSIVENTLRPKHKNTITNLKKEIMLNYFHGKSNSEILSKSILYIVSDI